MHAGQLGRHADDVDGPVLASLTLHHASAPIPLRGDSLSIAWRRVSSSFSSLDSLEGTSTRTVTSRSPLPPLGRGAPFPRMRNVLPEGVPAGTFSVTAPFNVGTFTLAPRVASANVTGTSSVRSESFRPNMRCGATLTTTNRSPGRLPAGPASPRPTSRMRCPSFTPGGILTENSRVVRTVPEPPHRSQGFGMICPEPPHRGQVRDSEKYPWFSATVPVPWHCGHTSGAVPGFAPEPPHTGHGAGPWIRNGTVVPFIASSKETRTSVSRSAPLVAPRVRAPRPRPVNMPRRSPRSPMSPSPWPNGNPSTRTRPLPAGHPPVPPPPNPPKPEEAISRTCSYCLRFSSSPRTS